MPPEPSEQETLCMSKAIMSCGGTEDDFLSPTCSSATSLRILDACPWLRTCGLWLAWGNGKRGPCTLAKRQSGVKHTKATSPNVCPLLSPSYKAKRFTQQPDIGSTRLRSRQVLFTTAAISRRVCHWRPAEQDLVAHCCRKCLQPLLLPHLSFQRVSRTFGL